LRHSAAHLLAHALLELYPKTQLTIGPATETGFFYDILPEKNIKEEDLAIITEKMREIAENNIPITHTIVSKDEAKKLFANNPFKIEIIEEQIKDDHAGIAKQGNFTDLCKGGHVPSTGHLKYFILTGISGSYWRGKRDGTTLQRISGVIFFTREEMDAYIVRQKELERYDHRRLGNDLDLFSFHEEGIGFPFIHPKGMIVFNQLASHMRAITTGAGYQEIRTPTLLSSELWKKSGHYAFYKENMYTSMIDDREYAVKPMNCPGAFIVFGSKIRTYKELPLRLSEHGYVHRHELSGVLHGLTRVRAFTQDDAHIFCRESQLKDEVILIMHLIQGILKKTGFNEYLVAISTRPEKAAGQNELWEKGITSLRNALDEMNIPYVIKEGDGAFYGPKIEVEVKDAHSRSWTCGTIQVDFVQPVNFDLNYITEKGEKERPVIIHQAMYGSFERFFAILLEHHRGVLPLWLAPVQIAILPITDEQVNYANFVKEKLEKIGIRVKINNDNTPLSGKIQQVQREKIPLMVIIGKKEMLEKSMTIRYFDGTQKKYESIATFIDWIKEEIA